MDSRCALLPNLNSCFIYMQAYQRHRRKIEEIRKSPSAKKKKGKRNDQNMSQEEKETEAKVDSVSPDKQTLKRQTKHRLSPRTNQNQYEIRKENSRLLERIRKCHSTIDRKSIQRHSQDSRKRKNLLSRFAYSQQSHKVVLRCRQSLQIMKSRQLESQNSSNPITRNPSRIRQPKTEASRIQTHGSSNQNQSNSSSKKTILTKFSLLKQDTKAQHQFKRSKVHLASKDFESLKFNFWNSSKKRTKTDIRKPASIFFTQLQS